MRFRYNFKVIFAFTALTATMPLYNNCTGFQAANFGDGGFSQSSEIFQNANFKAASTILQQKCASCHMSGGQAATLPLTFATENEFVGAGLVVPGSPDQSKLIYRLQNFASTNGTNTMPLNGTPLSNAEYGILRNWIMAMSTSQSGPFTCDPSEPAASLDARRLSRVQYFNSLRSLLVLGFPPDAQGVTQADTMMKWYPDVMATIPRDGSETYSTGDQNFSASHAQAYFTVADGISDDVTQSWNYSGFVKNFIDLGPGACVVSDYSALSVDCQKAFVRNFTLRAFGRPIEETDENGNNEMASFLQEFQLAADSVGAIKAVVFKTLMSPEFLLQPALDVTPAAGSTYKLNSFAVARRLALAFTQSLPDESLLAMAAAKDLSTDEGFFDALQYVSQNMDPLLKSYTTEWLHLDELPGYGWGPKFDYISAALTADEMNQLPSQAVSELQDLVSYIASANRPARELFLSNVSFARGSGLMKIYGQSTPAPASVNEANAVRFDSTQRVGLLTRAAWLFTGGNIENLIIRGSHARKYLLCLSMPDPPANLPAGSLSAPTPTSDETTRQAFEIKTSSTVCMSCHTQINPAGFALSQFNAFGGLQLQEPMFENVNGTVQMTHTLPTDAAVDLSPLGIPKQTTNAIDFSGAIADSSLYQACMTKNLYTFTQGLGTRPTSSSSCTMSHMYQVLKSGGTFMDFIQNSALDPRFRYRTISR